MTEPATPGRVAYFSMEIALDPAIPTYSGGLGILAGDTLRSAADLALPLCAVSLAYRKGYFLQHIDAEGNQSEEPESWVLEDHLEEQAARVSVKIEGQQVVLRAWKYNVQGVGGSSVPVFLLDTDLPENSDYHRSLTGSLYQGDEYYRLCQELVLGVGGVRMLRSLGYHDIDRFHMNEGHAALLTLELLNESAAAAGRDHVTREDVTAVRHQCVFTTHTPVPAGHDKFPMELVQRVLGNQQNFLDMRDLFCPEFAGKVLEAHGWQTDLYAGERLLNMTYLALNASHYVNGVAKKHAEVSRLMFADYEIESITNGVHAATWVSPPFEALFDRYIPGWRKDNFSLRYALKIPGSEIWAAHQEAKAFLVRQVNGAGDPEFSTEVVTLGFARRATSYKRGKLMLSDPGRLRKIAEKCGGLQIVYAGKAHPHDAEGKEIIREVVQVSHALGDAVKIIYLEQYDMALAKLLTAGVDLWINTPKPPLEASGTSGMKAALNGVPSLSVLDGWWIEGCIEGVTGWGISPGDNDTTEFYEKLDVATGLYTSDRGAFLEMMRHAVALNGSFFNTQRMVLQYVLRAYFG